MVFVQHNDASAYHTNLLASRGHQSASLYNILGPNSPTEQLVLERCLVVALRPQTPKHIRGGWSHYTDTSEPVDGGVGTLQL
jgi:hypothetical protein